MSGFWSGWIIVLTIGNILGVIWLIWWTMKSHADSAASGDTTGHTWDDDLQEFNNPLPRWWLWLFYITILFGVIYFALYPGLGSFTGTKGWTQVSQYEEEMAKAEAKYAPIYAKYAALPITDLATKAEHGEAREMGKRLFLTYCMQCHGSDARGHVGYPNLADKAWLWGGSPEQIKASIANGRTAMMPAHGHLDDAQIAGLAEHVRSLAGLEHDSAKAAEGKQTFMTAGCLGCHGPDGSGNPMLGAANLTDQDWLYGSTADIISKTIKTGRQGVMPAHQELLGSDKVHLLAAYVYSLSAE